MRELPERIYATLSHPMWERNIEIRGLYGDGGSCKILAYKPQEYIRLYWFGWETIEQFDWNGEKYVYRAPGARERIFLAVISHKSNIKQRDACRETWLTLLPSKIEYKFFVGGEEPDDMGMGDVIVLRQCPDDYMHLPTKVVATMQFAYNHFDWFWFGKCDDDAYLVGTRLHTILKHGRFIVGDQTNSNDYCMGGCYFMARPAVRGVLDSRHYLMAEGPEDAVVISAAVHAGFPITNVHGKIYQGRYENCTPNTNKEVVCAHPFKTPEELRDEHAKRKGNS